MQDSIGGTRSEQTDTLSPSGRIDTEGTIQETKSGELPKEGQLDFEDPEQAKLTILQGVTTEQRKLEQAN